MSKPGRMLRIKQITRDMVRGMPRSLFVFDDNMRRTGADGQAAAMRGEPNAIGIPTRWRPGNEPQAFFTDEDWRSNGIFQTISEAFDMIERALIDGRTVVVPSDGFGTGFADLPRRAPQIHAFIRNRIAELEADYPG